MDAQPHCEHEYICCPDFIFLQGTAQLKFQEFFMLLLIILIFYMTNLEY